MDNAASNYGDTKTGIYIILILKETLTSSQSFGHFRDIRISRTMSVVWKMGLIGYFSALSKPRTHTFIANMVYFRG